MSIGLGKDYYRIENFKYKEEADEKDINYIIQNDRIHPIHIDLSQNYMFFLEVDSKIDHNKVAFFYEPLQSKAKYIIRVDIEDFYSYMETCKKHFHENKILFIHHPGRCGSTLLHKILGSNPQIESFSEHLVFNNLFLVQNTNLPNFNTFCKSFFSYLYKRYTDGNYSKYLSLKMTGSSAKYIDKLLNILPDAKHIYITRDPIDISESFTNLLMNNRIGKIKVGYILKWVGFFSRKRKKIWEKRQGNEDRYGFKIDKYFSLGIINEKVKRIRSANFAELIILRVLITDRQFQYYSQQNLININYNEVLQKNILFDTLLKFLNLEYGFDESVYNTHSHLNSIGDISIKKKYKYSDDSKNNLISFQKNVAALL